MQIHASNQVMGKGTHFMAIGRNTRLNATLIAARGRVTARGVVALLGLVCFAMLIAMKTLTAAWAQKADVQADEQKAEGPEQLFVEPRLAGQK